jgi:hypothetical protein
MSGDLVVRGVHTTFLRRLWQLAALCLLVAAPTAAHGAEHAATLFGPWQWVAVCAGIIAVTIVGVLSMKGRSRIPADDFEIVHEVWE